MTTGSMNPELIAAASKDEMLAAFRRLPGMETVIAAQVAAGIALDEAEVVRLQACITDCDARAAQERESSQPAIDQADAAVADLQTQLTVAAEVAYNVRNAHVSRLSPLTTERSALGRELNQVRERIAVAKGERKPMSDAALQLIKAPEAPPLIDPSKRHPPTQNGFMNDGISRW